MEYQPIRSKQDALDRGFVVTDHPDGSWSHRSPGVLDQVLALFPSHVKPTTIIHDNPFDPAAVSAEFDPTCAGAIERAWPAVFNLCENLACEARLISTDTIETKSELSSHSAAPDFSTVHRHRVVLVLTPTARELARVA